MPDNNYLPEQNIEKVEGDIPEQAFEGKPDIILSILLLWQHHVCDIQCLTDC